MKINWKARFKNKIWVTTFVGAIIAFAYQIMSMFGIAPKIDESSLMDMFKTLLTLLVGIGVITDPTTKGTSDSEQALTYYHEQEEENEL